MSAPLAIITGAADGIGLSIANCFVQAGYQVAVCDVNADAVCRVQGASNGISASVIDVAEPDQLTEFMEQAIADFGPLSVLVNNVGIAGPRGFVEELDNAWWSRTMAINVDSMFHAAKCAIRSMKPLGKGAIVNLSSMGTYTLPPQRSVYNTSKWAVEGFTRSLARELGPFGLRCNAILPGVVNGERMRCIMRDRSASENKSMEELHAEYVEGVAMNTFVDPEDIGEMAVFLSSDKARYVTGQLIAVCGGIFWEN